MWSEVVDQLADLPYRVIVPDILGYAGTSKPTDIALYKWSGQSADLLEILEAEDTKDVIIIGHDWGSVLAQRFYNHHPEVVSGMVLCNVSYRPPNTETFDLAKLNAFTEKTIGYPLFKYWEFFTSKDGAQVIDENLEKFWEVLHGDVDDWMKKMFSVKDAMPKYLKGSERVPLRPYAKLPKWKNDFMQRFGRDGFEAPTCWYKATAFNVQSADDASIPKENAVVRVPFFFIGCTGDSVGRTDMAYVAKEAGFLPDFELTELQSGHWCAMEVPDQVAKAIRGWLTKRFLKAGEASKI